MRKYYGFQLMYGIKTTMGDPNETTGSKNIAGHMTVFSSSLKRDEWADGRKRLAVTKTTLRHLCRGMTIKNFSKMLKIYGA